MGNLTHRCPICGGEGIPEGLVWCESCDGKGFTPSSLARIEAAPLRQQPSMRKAVGEMEFKKCALDPMYWLDASRHMPTEKWPKGIPYVFTHDPHTMYTCTQCEDELAYTGDKLQVHLEMRHGVEVANPLHAFSFFQQLPAYRPFPIMPYVAPIVESWLTSYLYAVEKSRDMMMTWLMILLHGWDTLFHEGRQYIFQSEDGPKAAELVKRVNIVYEHQPKFLKALQGGKYQEGKSRSGVFTVQRMGSEILGFPQGADQVRQYHPTGLYQDEAAFQIEAAAAFAAAKPAIQNGGRFTAVSTAYPGWFQAIVQDTLDNT